MVCTECGARISEGSDRCDLCGTPVERGSEIPHENEVVEADDKQVNGAESKETPAKLFAAEQQGRCPSCGRLNRPDAAFCDQCGTPLSRVKTAPASTKAAKREGKVKKKPAPQARPVEKVSATTGEPEAKSRVGTLIIAGIILVAALYGITVFSKSRSEPEPVATVPAQQESAGDSGTYLPEDQGLAEQAASIRSAIAEAGDDESKLSLRRQLVDMYASNGRLDLAGREQDIVAEAVNTADDWTFAGNLHFDWMEQQSGAERVNAAQRAVASYVKSLEIEPDNLDVRTDLGVAYLNDPASPMLAIQETNAVLEQNPDHIQANFNKGVMLLQIGRQADAIEHFEKVKSLTEPGTPAHERALSVLEQVGETSG